jgi:hypothetical protein
MKSFLTMRNYTIDSEIKYVKFISLVIGSLIHFTFGRVRYYIYTRWLLLISVCFAFTCSAISLLSRSSSIEFYLIQIMAISFSLFCLKKFTKTSKQGFTLIIFALLINFILIYDLKFF